MSYWKVAGLTYLEYITIATTALRQAVKPSNAAKYAPREEATYKLQLWKDGKATTPRNLIRVDPKGKTTATTTAGSATTQADPTGGNA